MQRKKFFTAFAVMLVLSTLAACGFHLRGQESIPTEFKAIYLRSSQPYSNFMRMLRTRLQNSNVQLVDTPMAAPFILDITSESETRSEQSLSIDNRLRTYELTYSVQYQILNQKQEIVVPKATLNSKRNYTAFVEQALGTTNEESRLISDMQREIIGLMLYRLGSKHTQLLLKRVQKKPTITHR